MSSGVSSGGPSMMGSLGGAMAMGAAAGVGSAVAHQAINSVMGGGSHAQQAPQQVAPQ